jgi:tetratricopeptide (TPR) repeat protein
LVRYGKRGEEQHGIDIIDQFCSKKPRIAIQCKHHERTKTIPPKEIRDEVALAESSSYPLEHYIIATTAKKSRKAQDTVVQLNERTADSRKFTVEIHFWEDISSRLTEFGRAIADFIVYCEQPEKELFTPIQRGVGSYAALESTNDDEELYSEIDTLFKDRKLEVAEHEISKLGDPEQDSTLNVRQRYLILRLRAKLALEHQHFDEAARLFTLAYDTCPDLKQARENHLLALELSGKFSQAFAETERLLKEGMDSPLVVRVLINTSSTPSDLAQHQDTINKHISSSEDVNLAIVHKYLGWCELEPAADAAQRALGISPNSAHACFACGMVAHHAALRGNWQHRNENLAKAIHHYTEAIVAAERDKYSALLPEVYSNRARVHTVTGNLSHAAQDYRSSVRISPRPGLYAESAVSFFLNIEDFDSAQELIPVLDTSSNEAAFLIAVTEYHRASRDEKESRIIALATLAGQQSCRATEARFLCVQWAIELENLELARQCVTESFVERQPFQGNTLLGWVELEAGNEGKAQELAALALDSSSRAAHQQEIAVLASLLVRLGQDEKALPLLEQVATPGVLDFDCKRLIECAQRLERHDTLLRICSELRHTNRQDDKIRKLEVQLLSHYAPGEAFDLAKQFLKHDTLYFAVVCNYLAVRLGRLDEVHFDDSNLPNPDDFPPEEAYLVVTPYIETRRYCEALEFAYHQLRTHFSEECAHGQYIGFVLQYGKDTGIPNYTEVVDEQSAVRLENRMTGEQRWVIAEDRQPDSTRNEYSCATPVVQALLGKQKDNVVDISGQSLQPQQERIVEIQSKYARLFQDAISNFQHRFPGAGTIQSIHLEHDGQFDPSPLLEGLKARRQYAEEATTFYHNNPCSLHLLASRLGRTEREIMLGLADHDESFVRCVECTPQQYAEIAAAEIIRKKIVLDVSAIVTISQLDAWSKLNREWEYIISQGTSDLIAGWLHQTETGAQPAMYSYLSDDGRMVLQDVTQEQLDKKHDDIQTIVTEVSALSAVKSSIAVAKLDPKRRERYVQFLGLHSLESMSIAKDEDALLWTDDLFVGLLAETDFGVKRVWTQLVFKVLENEKRIDVDAYNEITAKLAAWNYITTVFNPQDVIAAGRLCDWDVQQWPLRQCIRLIGTCPLPPLDKARLAIEVLRLLRQSACIELRQSPVVQAVLDSVGDARAVQWMLRRLDRLFPIDIPSAEFLKCELSYWLRLR